MLAFDKALEIILHDVKRTDTERVCYEESLFRVLAEDITIDSDMPPFDKAAMDGYACRNSDLGSELKVLGMIAAGDVPRMVVEPGQCVKIMTGAMVPEGADTVIMSEYTEATVPGFIRFTGEKTASNIAYKAEELRAGDQVLSKGVRIFPQHIAILSAAGHTSVLVAKRVRVGIISTGDELVEPSFRPEPGKIRNSNGHQLAAQVTACGCTPNYMGIVADDREATDHVIKKGLAENDVVILSGGVSAGDFDFVPEVLRHNGVRILFQKVAVKPGRPTVYGRKDKEHIFGLPGNPVSSFINFETFVRPLLFAMMGSYMQPLEIKMPMAVDFNRKKADRLEYLPVHISISGEITPVRYRGSAHIHAICEANGLMRIPKGVFKIKKGGMTYVRPL